MGSRNLKILFVVPYMPGPIRVRSYQIIRSLAARGHRITLAAPWTTPQELDDLERLRPYCERILTAPLPAWRSALNALGALFGRAPLQAVYSWSPALARALREMIREERCDAVHVEHLRGAHYGLLLRELAGPNGPPVVWDSVDCISALFRQAAQHSQSRTGRWMARFELPRTARYEGWLLGRFERVLVTSQADRDALLDLPARQQATAEIHVLPNGVDSDYFCPDGEVRQENALVISGKMSYHANVTMCMDFVREVLPRIWAQRPELELWLVGKDPPAGLRALGQDPRINVTGTVADIRPYLRRATLAVAPLTYGAGIQNKVLEAMACATPVVTTPQAAAALAAVPGREVAVAAGPEGLAKAILALLARPADRAALGQAGRDYVLAHHHWQTIAASLEEVYIGNAQA